MKRLSCPSFETEPLNRQSRKTRRVKASREIQSKRATGDLCSEGWPGAMDNQEELEGVPPEKGLSTHFTWGCNWLRALSSVPGSCRRCSWGRGFPGPEVTLSLSIPLCNYRIHKTSL